MSMQAKQDNRGSVAGQWDTRTLDIRISQENWGLGPALVDYAIDILAEQGQQEPDTLNTKTISFPMFRDLVKILSEHGLDTRNIDAALIEFIEKQEEPLPFNNKWVLVAGTGKESLSEREQLISEALGKMLASAGYGMVCGGWEGVDETVSGSFSKYLRQHDLDDKRRLLILLEYKQKYAGRYGRIEQLNRNSSWYEEALKRAGALIFIGGKGGVYKSFRSARKHEMPVIPVPATGGDARLIYEELLQTDTLLGDYPIKNLDKPLRSETDARRLAAGIIKLLGSLDLKDIFPPLSEEDFRKIVNARYAKQEVVVLDDLQKQRWGGLAERDSKVLEAAVTRSAVPGLFDITLNVKAAPGSSLQGNVAFFLHNSFQNEIEYAYAVKGIAQIQMTAYEAFTAAAFTEDGTMLELDLNLENGYPEGFYYKDTATTFQERVAALYHAKSITVQDDLQKGRWGGLPIKNGKVFSATVSKALLPGYFKIVGELRSENKNELQGDVAFFLHDSFISEIIYRKVRGGLATFHITAYEAFTLGAYTDDGTELELDLQRQPGYPEEFYYEEEQAEQPARRGRKKK